MSGTIGGNQRDARTFRRKHRLAAIDASGTLVHEAEEQEVQPR